MHDRDRKILARLRRGDPRLRMPRVSAFRNKKRYVRKDKYPT